ncbi:probable protein phosphatase CG10417 [Macrobrachium nipponense]|uniref:probable protein phosphatase CG10417 n=1 Tax=Macrobrachium nipponense TaxID=159736 RepID=UPI0030C87AD3
MGAYLSVPVTDKISNDEEGKSVAYGASSMQGWRVSQEDAHNSILDFDGGTHLFAVYDGHGGHEVAAYTALKLPEFIKQFISNQENENFPECLKKAFLAFDSTLVKPEVVNILKQIAGTKDDESDSEEEEEEVDSLYREATMPLDEVMAKYAENPHLTRVMKEKKVLSPFLRARTGSSNSDVKSDDAVKFELTESECPESSSSSLSKNDPKSAESSLNESEKDGYQNGTEPQTSSQVNGDEFKHANGELDGDSREDSKDKSTKDCEKERKLENGEVLVNGGEGQEIGKGKGKGTKGGKGKALLKNSEIQALKEAESKEKKREAAVKAELIYRRLQEGASEDDELSDEDDDDEDDDNFEDDVDDDEDEGDSEEDDDDDEEDDEDEEIDDDDPYREFAMNMKEEPGFDSGCTACLALIRGSELYVANVGDSRIVVCRDGSAVDMSIDHKPEDDEETARIIKAGGRVTEDGRVNGGLNLSRAIGDHGYKQNKNLPPEDQMISPLPDVQSMTLGPQDQFMIVACDGIWNSLSSEEACTFVLERLAENKKLSTICEELFDHCLAPDTLGDGTGCDNMTCIIVKFKDIESYGSAKRKSEVDKNEESDNEDIRQSDKKLKCEDK